MKGLVGEKRGRRDEEIPVLTQEMVLSYMTILLEGGYNL